MRMFMTISLGWTASIQDTGFAAGSFGGSGAK
jgi:hypothetical protein